jgi:hypothetical protein
MRKQKERNVEEKNLKLVSEKAECLHSAAVILGPGGSKTYGLPTDVENCLDCGWRAFERACGKRVELPAVQIFWWEKTEQREAHWVVECFPGDLVPDEASIIGRGENPGAAMNNLARAITFCLMDPNQ